MSAPLWTSEDIATATGGHGAGPVWSVAGVAIDSRTVQPGELFVALAGPRHDGHDFVADALRRGAAALIHRPVEGIAALAPVIMVGDTLQALTDLGAAARARSGAGIIAVTGSVGKTGTKEALRHVLSRQATTHASAASHNNHWGVPLSLARLPCEARFGVIELGMNAPGEIDRLARLVRPEVALITNIEAAHLGFFRSLDGIADAKSEIFNGLQAGGTAILNRDSPQFTRLAAAARAAGVSELVTFGEAADAGVRLLGAELNADGSTATISLRGRSLTYRIGAPGQHWVRNSLGVLATVAAIGADPDRAAADLAEFRPPAGRGQRHTIPWDGGEMTLIDESYNANPASMRAALDLLASAPGRRIAVLGDMLELGQQGAELHRELAAKVVDADCARVDTVGPLMAELRDALPARLRGDHVERSHELVPRLLGSLAAGDTVLVKGSLGSRMGVIIEALLTAETRSPVGSGGV